VIIAAHSGPTMEEMLRTFFATILFTGAFASFAQPMQPAAAALVGTVVLTAHALLTAAPSSLLQALSLSNDLCRGPVPMVLFGPTDVAVRSEVMKDSTRRQRN
jgi:ABC-type phosphate transport system permease subunit